MMKKAEITDINGAKSYILGISRHSKLLNENMIIYIKLLEKLIVSIRGTNFLCPNFSFALT